MGPFDIPVQVSDPDTNYRVCGYILTICNESDPKYKCDQKSQHDQIPTSSIRTNNLNPEYLKEIVIENQSTSPPVYNIFEFDGSLRTKDTEPRIVPRIKLKEPLDREIQAEYRLRLIAFDCGVRNTSDMKLSEKYGSTIIIVKGLLESFYIIQTFFLQYKIF